MTLYVFSTETKEYVATIVGDTNKACEDVMARHFGSNDYSATYSPAFGTRRWISGKFGRRTHFCFRSQTRRLTRQFAEQVSIYSRIKP